MSDPWVPAVKKAAEEKKAEEKKAVAHTPYVAPASPWKQFMMTDYGIPYWFNTSTGATTWNDPRDYRLEIID